MTILDEKPPLPPPVCDQCGPAYLRADSTEPAMWWCLACGGCVGQPGGRRPTAEFKATKTDPARAVIPWPRGGQ